MLDGVGLGVLLNILQRGGFSLSSPTLAKMNSGKSISPCAARTRAAVDCTPPP